MDKTKSDNPAVGQNTQNEDRKIVDGRTLTTREIARSWLVPGSMEDMERAYNEAVKQMALPVWAGKSGPYGFRPERILVDDLAPEITHRTPPRSYRMTRVFPDRDARLSPEDRREYLYRDIESHILSTARSRGKYKEKRDHIRGDITATVDVSLSDFVNGLGETPLIDDEKIAREVKEAVWSGLRHILTAEIQAIEARDGYQDDVRAEALRNLQDKLEKTL